MLWCYQLGNGIPAQALASWLPQPPSSGIIAEHEEKQVLGTSTSSQAKGRTEETRNADCPSRFTPPQVCLFLSPCSVPREQGLDILQHTSAGKIMSQHRSGDKGTSKAWPVMRGPATHSQLWLFKDTQRRSHFLEQWILHWRQ